MFVFDPMQYDYSQLHKVKYINKVQRRCFNEINVRQNKERKTSEIKSKVLHFGLLRILCRKILEFNLNRNRQNSISRKIWHNFIFVLTLVIRSRLDL